MTIKRTKLSQSSALSYYGSDAGGVCLTVCRRWIKACLTDQWTENETVYDTMDMNSLKGVLEEQKEAGTLADSAINGTQHSVSARRSGGGSFSKFSGLRTRGDVIGHVLGVPGAFIYAALPKKNGAGHAFAFDSRNLNKILFVDPNQGEWVFENESKDAMKAWWKTFWDGSGDNKESLAGEINYKELFNKGERELWLYKTP